MKKLIPLALSVFLFASCVSSKKYQQAQDDYNVLNNKYTQLQQDLENCETDLVRASNHLQTAEAQNTSLKEQLQTSQTQNTQVMERLAEMNVLSGRQAESVQASLAKIAERDARINLLQDEVTRKDSLNMVLVLNLKRGLSQYDEDIDIQVEKGVVYISISDKLLFSTGSYEVNRSAYTVLEKVATVLNNQPNIEFMVEGHTDNVPIRGGAALKDNWDLSVLRATSVVRLLQNNFNIDPKRMTAGGRSYYNPVAENSTVSGRASNRRTRIVILPQLDQFFQLMEDENKTAEPPAK